MNCHRLRVLDYIKGRLVYYRPGVGAGISAGVFGVVGATAGLTGVGRGLSAGH